MRETDANINTLLVIIGGTFVSLAFTANWYIQTSSLSLSGRMASSTPSANQNITGVQITIDKTN